MKNNRNGKNLVHITNYFTFKFFKICMRLKAKIITLPGGYSMHVICKAAILLKGEGKGVYVIVGFLKTYLK